MEYILMSLFGGGICDWQDIAQTQYEWDEIFERARARYGFDITINDLYETILNMAVEDLEDLISNYISKAETEEEMENVKQYEKIMYKNNDILYYKENIKIGNCINIDYTREDTEIKESITYRDIDNEEKWWEDYNYLR